MLFLGFTPVFGALVNGEFNLFNILLLLVAGCLFHVFTFVQNDYFDVDVDQKSIYVANRPLSSGSVSLFMVVLIIGGSFIFSLLIALVFFFSYYSFFALLIAFFCITVYNRLSKRFAGMEYILGAGVLFFGLFGALTVSDSISWFVMLVVWFGFFQWLFSVGVSANLKDVEFDTKQGISTTPVLLGAHISENSLVVPWLFKVYAFVVKFIHILMAFFILFFGYASFFVGSFPFPGVLFGVISVILLYLTYRILYVSFAERDSMLIFIGLQEGLSFLLLPVALMSVLIENFSLSFSVLLLVVLIVWPMFWFRVLFGGHLIPLE
jgi:4-hydroxybenzoate polyprenyltransferase